MELDLNNPQDFTLDNVKRLIASKDDSIDRQLRVTLNGIAYISDKVAGDDVMGLAFRLETWDAGNSYLGVAASNDQRHITRIYNCLKLNWPTPSSSYIDVY
ncbi:hypothetical protein [Marinomonas arenicola]|uniref:Uncharacterized protein n=1 Tax=Marinomonas arenicola TaxID=569601 RepID=A0ABU9GAS3_9GAMM